MVQVKPAFWQFWRTIKKWILSVLDDRNEQKLLLILWTSLWTKIWRRTKTVTWEIFQKCVLNKLFFVLFPKSLIKEAQLEPCCQGVRKRKIIFSSFKSNGTFLGAQTAYLYENAIDNVTDLRACLIRFCTYYLRLYNCLTIGQIFSGVS